MDVWRLAILIVTIICQVGIFGGAVYTFATVPSAAAYFDSCCLPSSCDVGRNTRLPSGRSSLNRCIPDSAEAAAMGCARLAANCSLDARCPASGSDDRPFDRPGLILQSVGGLVEVLVAVVALTVLQLKKRDASIWGPRTDAILRLALFVTACVASGVSAVVGVAVNAIWGTKEVPLDAPISVVGGSGCADVGGGVRRFSSESDNFLRVVSGFLVAFVAFILIRFALHGFRLYNQDTPLIPVSNDPNALPEPVPPPSPPPPPPPPHAGSPAAQLSGYPPAGHYAQQPQPQPQQQQQQQYYNQQQQQPRSYGYGTDGGYHQPQHAHGSQHHQYRS